MTGLENYLLSNAGKNGFAMIAFTEKNCVLKANGTASGKLTVPPKKTFC
jgi:fructose-1,6-bisphosphatase/sedoheptulose 1,7-bisphosphatase-like protein